MGLSHPGLLFRRDFPDQGDELNAGAGFEGALVLRDAKASSLALWNCMFALQQRESDDPLALVEHAMPEISLPKLWRDVH
jgi:hypothetical protein